jgi:2-oxoglutarate dehydrogenase E2 component (dihydrolipoamide succinyltransferase)
MKDAMSGDLEIRAPTEESEGTRLQILRWLKRVGERVARDEPLIEIETDKVTVEVAAPGAGVLREILRHERDEITPGELLGHIDPGDSDEAASSAARGAAPQVSAGGPSARAAPASGSTADGMRGAAARSLSPAVRRLLAEHGLEPAAVPGSGEGGRITVEDVLRAAQSAAPASASDSVADVPRAPIQPAFAEGAAREPGGGAAGGPGGAMRRVPHTLLRKRTAEHMVQSLLQSAPHVTSVFEADLGAVLADRARRREEFARRGAPLTLSAYFILASVAAIRAVPEANSRWTDDALEIYESIHIGVATAVEGVGLMVPVLRDAESRDLFETARALEELISRTRAGRLTPADMRGGTFTISNHGVSGSLLAAPIIINQPQAAILGVGKLEKRPVVLEEGDEQKIIVRPRCYVTLTLDHRVMDGHQANRFLQTFVNTLNHWSA